MIGDVAECELIDAYDDDGNHLGAMTRSRVHDLGYWHRVVHCWVYYREAGRTRIVFQQRGLNKRMAPGKFDMAAAGHYIAGEHGDVGLRELEEELGIPLECYEMRESGEWRMVYVDEDIVDREIGTIYLCELLADVQELAPDAREVERVVTVDAAQLFDMLEGRADSVRAEGVRGASNRAAPTGAPDTAAETIVLTLDSFIDVYREYFCKTVRSILGS